MREVRVGYEDRGQWASFRRYTKRTSVPPSLCPLNHSWFKADLAGVGTIITVGRWPITALRKLEQSAFRGSIVSN